MEDRDTIIVNSCDCGCKCGEVELHSEHQPEVLLFDEYGELYENIIIQTHEVAKSNSDKLDTLLNTASQYFEEATTKEVEQMFDGFMVDDITMDLPSMDIDEQGYVALDMEVDEEGYVKFNNYLND